MLYMLQINPLVIYLSFFIYTGNNLDNLDKGKLILMLRVRQLSLVTSYPYVPSFLRAHYPYIALNIFRKCFLALFLSVIPHNYLSRKCGLYKASDLLLGDHV